jgi:hypothetical protein
MEQFRFYLELHFFELYDAARRTPQGEVIIDHLNDHASYIVKFFHLILANQGNHLSIENDVIPTGLDLDKLKILCMVIDWKFGGGSSGRSIINFEWDDIAQTGRIAFTP